jgi:hypothetical protein
LAPGMVRRESPARPIRPAPQQPYKRVMVRVF